jgi:hypothetical protein
MSRQRSDEREDALSVKLGNWFQAEATGRGVIAVPFVVLMIVLVVVASHFLFLR